MSLPSEVLKHYTIKELIDLRASLQMHNFDYEQCIRVINQCIDMTKRHKERMASDLVEHMKKEGKL